MQGVLVVAVCTKKDYMAVALPEKPLADSCWVSLDTNSTARTQASICPVSMRNDFEEENITHHFFKLHPGQ